MTQPELYKLARPKLNGYKCQILNGQVPDDIKNRMVRDILGGLPQFGGEIVVGKPEAEDCYARTKEFVESENTLQLFVFWVYDIRTTGLYDLQARLGIAASFVTACGPNVQFADHELLQSQKDIAKYKTKLLQAGFTGAILREPYGTFGTEDEEISTQPPM